MVTWVAIKLMTEGKKVRRVDWKEGQYIQLNEDGHFVDETGFGYELVCNYDDWEIYEEEIF